MSPAEELRAGAHAMSRRDHERLISHFFPLRPDLLIRLNLPEDLTVADAERVAEFVRTLAFDQADVARSTP